MTENQYNLILYIPLIFNWITFLFSLRTIGKNNTPSYMNGFYLYNLVGISIVTIFLFSHAIYFVNNILILFNFSFLGYFFLRASKKDKSFNIASFIFILFFGLTIFLLKSRLYEYPMARSVSGISGVGELLLCAYYFINSFGVKNEVSLKSEPAFWIALGVFVFLLFTIPLLLFDHFLHTNLDEKYFFRLALVYPFSVLIFDCCFIKAFLCTKKLDNSIHKVSE